MRAMLKGLTLTAFISFAQAGEIVTSPSVECVNLFIHRMADDAPPMTWQEGDAYFGVSHILKLQACAQLGYIPRDYWEAKVIKWQTPDMPVLSPVWALMQLRRSILFPPRGGEWDISVMRRESYGDGVAKQEQELVLVRWRTTDDAVRWMIYAVKQGADGKCSILWDWCIVNGKELYSQLGVDYVPIEHKGWILRPVLGKETIENLRGLLSETKPVTRDVTLMNNKEER